MVVGCHAGAAAERRGKLREICMRGDGPRAGNGSVSVMSQELQARSPLGHLCQVGI